MAKKKNLVGCYSRQMPHKHKKSGCDCGGATKRKGPKRKASPTIKWMGAKVKQLRKDQPGKSFGWYGKEAGRLCREQGPCKAK